MRPTSVAPDDLRAAAARLQTALADLTAVSLRQSGIVATPAVASTFGLIGADFLGDLHASGCRQTRAMDDLAVRLAAAGLAVRAAAIDYAGTDLDAAVALTVSASGVQR